MPSPRKPKAWNLKPQLTAAPELWGNSRYFVVPFWSGTRTTGITKGTINPLFSPVGSPADRETIKGRSRYFNGSSREDLAAPGFFDGVSELTIACYFIQRGNFFNQDFGVFGDGAKTKWDNSRAVQLVIGDVNDRELQPRFFINDTILTNVIGSSNEIVLNQPTTMVGTWSATDGAAKLFCNGKLSASKVGGTSALSTGHGDLIIASYYDHDSRQIDADFLMCVALAYKWSDEQAKQWMADPFAMLRPAGF